MGFANFPTNVHAFIHTVFTFYSDILKSSLSSRPSSGVPYSRESCVLCHTVYKVPATLAGVSSYKISCLPVFVFALGQTQLNTRVVCWITQPRIAVSAPGVAYNWHKALNFYLILKKTVSHIKVSLLHFNPIDHVFTVSRDLLLNYLSSRSKYLLLSFL